MTAPPHNKHRSIYQFLLCGLDRPTYLCLKDDAYTDSYTALATKELRATRLTVLCSMPLSNTLYRKTGNSAASVFIPICAGAAPAWLILMILHIFCRICTSSRNNRQSGNIIKCILGNVSNSSWNICPFYATRSERL